jgi:Alpha-glutamyl/putrescinyl thymine pyrophosphorylase clade 3
VVPTFCRHNRFIERCPICSKTLASSAAAGRSSTKPRRAATKGAPVRPRHPRLRAGGKEVRVKRENRAGDDGYRSGLLPGLRASGDAEALAQEIAFAHGRLLALGAAPPDLYGEVRVLAEEDIERATWMCFLIAYLSPLDGEDPFLGIRLVLDAAPDSAAACDERVLEDLDRVPLGPRTSHDPAHGATTLLAYRRWAERAVGGATADGGGAATPPAPGVGIDAPPVGIGRPAAGIDAPPVGISRPAAGIDAPPAGIDGPAMEIEGPAADGGPATDRHTPADAGAARAFNGDPEWSPQRRFERAFERLALPGFGRMGRYDLLVTLGRLGLYELRADSLHMTSASDAHSGDLTTLAAKRVFAIGDSLLLERRAQALAEAISVPIETLDLALANWNPSVPEARATLGVREERSDPHALERCREALELSG